MSGDATQSISIRLPANVVDEADRRRGSTPRASFLAALVARGLNSDTPAADLDSEQLRRAVDLLSDRTETIEDAVAITVDFLSGLANVVEALFVLLAVPVSDESPNVFTRAQASAFVQKELRARLGRL